jgi:TPP-dependent 2-oxoacid decarboxylase
MAEKLTAQRSDLSVTVRDIVEKLNLSVSCGGDRLEEIVTGGYVSDLLSDVMANSSQGNIWITMQAHTNVVAVASLKELAAIIIVQGREPAEDTVERARSEKVTILGTTLPTFALAGKLYEMGIGRVD